jgi:hypothetical protein
MSFAFVKICHSLSPYTGMQILRGESQEGGEQRRLERGSSRVEQSVN